MYVIRQLGDPALVPHHLHYHSLGLLLVHDSLFPDHVVLPENIPDLRSAMLGDLMVLLLDELTGGAERFSLDPAKLDLMRLSELHKGLLEESLVLF